MPIRPGAIACLLLPSVAVSLAHSQIRAVHSAFDFEEAARQESVRRRPTASEAVHPGPGLHHDYADLYNAKSRRDLPIRRRLQLELSLRQTLRIDLKTLSSSCKNAALQCGLRMKVVSQALSSSLLSTISPRAEHTLKLQHRCVMVYHPQLSWNTSEPSPRL